MNIDESIRRLRKYAKTVEGSTHKSMKKHSARIAKMNVQQMEQGLKEDGTTQEPYSEGSVAYFGYDPGPIRLKSPGSSGGRFHRGVVLKPESRKNYFELTSKANYMTDTGENITEFLDKHYDPFGLVDRNMDIVTDLVCEDLYNDLKTLFA